MTGADVVLLKELWADMETLARGVGLPPAGLDFHPHVTIGRFRSPPPAEAYDCAVTPTPWCATQFNLFESTRDFHMVTYTSLSSALLKQDGLGG